jgi:hypothetical protein
MPSQRTVNAVKGNIEIRAYLPEIYGKTHNWAVLRPIFAVCIGSFGFLLLRTKIIFSCACIFFLTTPDLLLYSMIPSIFDRAEFRGGVLL